MIKEILASGKVVALTGAGISEESGVSTFRGDSGIWRRYNPAVYANVPGLVTTFLVRPHKVVDFVTEFYDVLLNAKPNPGHFALSELETRGVLSSIITQNVDNLHQQAGSKKVIELHGNMFEFRCLRCKLRMKLGREELNQIVLELRQYRHSRSSIGRLLRKCRCGGRMRPDVVLFGEALDHARIRLAEEEIDNSNILLIIGTSGSVYPAASLPWYARRRGKVIIEVNPDRTAFSPIADHFLKGKAGQFLPSLLG